MSRSKRKREAKNHGTASKAGRVATPTTLGGGESAGYNPRPPSSLRNGMNGGMGSGSLPIITRGPEALRQMQVGSPVQRTSGNEALILKIEYLSKIAKWAAHSAIPSLGALYGSRLSSTCQSAGIPSPVLNSQCERCESVLLSGVNCSVRLVPLSTKKKKRIRGKVKTGNGAATETCVVYQCHFCKYGNQKSGGQREQVKSKRAESGAATQMKHLASKSSEGGNPSTAPVTPAESPACLSSDATSPANQSVTSNSKKRKRKGWTGLKALATSLQNRDLQTPEGVGSEGGFSKPWNPRKNDRTGPTAKSMSMQNRHLKTLEAVESERDFTSPLNPRKKLRFRP